MIISLDTETTGVDIAHGALPFLVTTCDDDGVIRFWQWPVDPTTRRPDIDPQDLADIAELIDAADLIYLQNAKFDHRALAAVGVDLPWSKVRDTLVMGHLLASNHPHDLTSMCIEYLGVDIEPHELRVKKVVQECRAIVKKRFPDWLIADEGVPGMPSVKASSDREEDKPWKNDMWLPEALANELVTSGAMHEAEIDPDWLEACHRYANADSEHTLPLGLEMERMIRERGYWKIYEHRLHMPRVFGEMETYGVSVLGDVVNESVVEYGLHVAEAEAAMVEIAESEYGHKLVLAKGAALNDNMRDFFYGAASLTCPRCDYTKRLKHWNGEQPNNEDCPKCLKGTKRRPGMRHRMLFRHTDNLGLRVIESVKTGNATLDKSAMAEYLQTLDDGPALDFVELLADKRMYDTALTYIHAYRRYWVPVKGRDGFYRIHPSLNPCGTDHLRAASNSPNMQNVSGETKELSNRACFGPLPDREWWTMDFKSIESRIPPYECGEPKMIEVFEKPGEAPYWGNMYLLTASVLYPEEYWPLAEIEGAFRKEHPKLYKKAKFFVLAKQYGCGRPKGDLLSGIRDSFDRVDSEFPLMAALQQHYLSMAERMGYVETIPDRTVDPDRGYPILAARGESGRVLSTTPFNYHVSGTACWCKNTALVRCADQCAEWRAEGFDAHAALEVHDELIFDFPRGATMDDNLPRALTLKGLMEQSGANLIPAIPTPVSVKYHTESWAKGVDV